MKYLSMYLIILLTVASCTSRQNTTQATEPMDSLYNSHSNMMEKIRSNQINLEQYKSMTAQFREEFKKRKTAKMHDSGLMYEVLTEGNGKTPSTDSRVRVNYKVQLIDGTVIDDTATRKKAEDLEINKMIKAWSIGLPLMKTGSIFRFVVPPELAYQDTSDSKIPAYSTFVMEIELVSVLR